MDYDVRSKWSGAQVLDRSWCLDRLAAPAFIGSPCTLFFISNIHFEQTPIAQFVASDKIKTSVPLRAAMRDQDLAEYETGAISNKVRILQSVCEGRTECPVKQNSERHVVVIFHAEQRGGRG